MKTEAQQLLTKRWTRLRPKAPQIAAWLAGTRFRIIPAGRRSGKTEKAKRFVVIGDPENGLPGALTYDRPFDDGFFVCTAPTHDQAKSIFWEDMKALVPKKYVVKISESERSIKLFNNVTIRVAGLDRPERIEGRPIDGIVMDEYGNMKPEAWPKHVRPALSTVGREGWAWLIGVPEGRNHYYELYRRVVREELSNWSAHTWPSSLVLPEAEVEAAREELDELTFQQEYEASFVEFAGRAYYAFGSHNLAALQYDPREPLIFCFDFNVSPGTAVICQEQNKRFYSEQGIKLPSSVAVNFTAVIGEVYIPQHSNTERVCRKLIEEWGDHPGGIKLYGDATGGARGTAAVTGSDWDIIEDMLQPVFEKPFFNNVGNANPRERVRVNTVNSRCKSAAGVVRVLLDPDRAPNTLNDLEGVRVLEGTAGELDKDSDPMLTHLSDALGYYLAEEYAVGTVARSETLAVY